jgi:hypothetical protein
MGRSHDSAIGFHGISADIIKGQSLSGINGVGEPVPEPAVAALLGVGGVAFILRRRPAYVRNRQQAIDSRQ